MSLKEDVLTELLTRGDYVSGEELANKFNKSRAAVWKAVRSLKADGCDIDAVTNKGYRLTESNNIVTAQAVRAKLRHDVDVLYYPSVDSTNNECKRLLANGKRGVFLVTADGQTSGRGRQGRSFFSPSGTGVYFSLVLRPESTLQNAVKLTTVAAVAVSRSIEELCALEPKIKWVNDVYVNGKKVCGILTEAVSDFETGTVDSIIIGIGINISTSDFPDSAAEAGALNSAVSRAELIAAVTDRLLDMTEDSGDYLDYYRAHSFVIGEKISIIRNGVVTPALATSITPEAGLEVQLDSGERLVLTSGEISIRKRPTQRVGNSGI